MNGIDYKNVIEIQEVDWAMVAGSEVEQLFSVTYRVYAEDVRETYSMETDHWDGDTSTREFTLIKHFKS